MHARYTCCSKHSVRRLSLDLAGARRQTRPVAVRGILILNGTINASFPHVCRRYGSGDPVAAKHLGARQAIDAFWLLPTDTRTRYLAHTFASHTLQSTRPVRAAAQRASQQLADDGASGSEEESDASEEASSDGSFDASED